MEASRFKRRQERAMEAKSAPKGWWHGGGTVVAQQYPSPKGRLPDVPKDGTRDAGKRSQTQKGVGGGQGSLGRRAGNRRQEPAETPSRTRRPPGTPLGEGTHSNISSRCSSALVVVAGEGDEPRQVECRRNGHPRTHTQEPTHSVPKVGREKKHGQKYALQHHRAETVNQGRHKANIKKQKDKSG